MLNFAVNVLNEEHFTLHERRHDHNSVGSYA